MRVLLLVQPMRQLWQPVLAQRLQHSRAQPLLMCLQGPDRALPDPELPPPWPLLLQLLLLLLAHPLQVHLAHQRPCLCQLRQGMEPHHPLLWQLCCVAAQLLLLLRPAAARWRKERAPELRLQVHRRAVTLAAAQQLLEEPQQAQLVQLVLGHMSQQPL